DPSSDRPSAPASDRPSDPPSDPAGGPSSDAPESDDRIGLPTGAAWALPFVRFERRWTWLEVRVMFASLLALTLVLCAFFSMRGMKEPLEAAESAGTVFRALFGAAVLGGLSRLATRNRPDKLRNIVTL